MSEERLITMKDVGKPVRERKDDKWSMLQAVYPIAVGIFTAATCIILWYAFVNNQLLLHASDISLLKTKVDCLEKGREENRLFIEALKTNQENIMTALGEIKSDLRRHVNK